MKYKGDLIGGTTASMLGFPQAMAFGVLVFSPLGPEFMPLGIVAGLISLFIAIVIDFAEVISDADTAPEQTHHLIICVHLRLSSEAGG